MYYNYITRNKKNVIIHDKKNHVLYFYVQCNVHVSYFYVLCNKWNRQNYLHGEYESMKVIKQEKAEGPVKNIPVGSGTLNSVNGRVYVHFSASRMCNNIRVCIIRT